MNEPFQIGESVYVHAFGRQRIGRVVKLGRTRITVEFVRNQRGELDVRSFPAWAVERWSDIVGIE
jgi:hypothetical protein